MRRRVLASIGGKTLPYDAEVEWIESDFNCAIDSGVLLKDPISWIVRGRITAKNGNVAQFLICGATQNYETRCGVQRFCGAIADWYYWGSSSFNAKYNVPVNVDYVEIARRGYLNTSEIISQGSAPLVDTDATIGLFARKRGNDYDGFSHAMMYSCEIYQNNVLVRDFVPVKKNGIGYLFDRCGSISSSTGTSLYANVCTGAFIIGPNKT